MKRRRRFAKWELDRHGRPTVPFFWVIEYTKRGWPHLHVIVLHRGLLNKREIEALWERHNIGRIVDLQNRNKEWQEIGAVGLASYLTKYLVKELARPGVVAFRRWSSSHGFLIPRQRKRAYKTGFSSASIEAHRTERHRAGAHVVDASVGFRWEHEGATWSEDFIRFVHPSGLTFDERLALTSSPTGPSGVTVPDSVRRGVRHSRRLGFDWEGALSDAPSTDSS